MFGLVVSGSGRVRPEIFGPIDNSASLCPQVWAFLLVAVVIVGHTQADRAERRAKRREILKKLLANPCTKECVKEGRACKKECPKEKEERRRCCKECRKAFFGCVRSCRGTTMEPAE